MAHSLWNHRKLLLNWFHVKGAISAGIVEGLNNKVKLTMRIVVWFSDIGNDRNQPVSQLWGTTAAGIHTQILVRRLCPNVLDNSRIVLVAKVTVTVQIMYR